MTIQDNEGSAQYSGDRAMLSEQDKPSRESSEPQDRPEGRPLMATSRQAEGTRRGNMWLRRDLPLFPLAVLATLLVCAIFAPLLAPHSPTQIDMSNAEIPPFRSLSNLLGTDTLGRDILSRLIYGARTSAIVAFAGLSTTAVVGTAIGLVSGYYGGTVDTVVMRFVDIGLSFPTILAALVIAVFMGVGAPTVIVAIMVTTWAKFARMVRGDALAVRSRNFVALARIAGVSTPMIMWRHILPNVLNTLMVVASVLLGQVILLESTLSFLGLGLAPGSPAWGIMVAEGRALLVDVWWLALFPGIAITVVVAAMNMLGDWLRDFMDPTLQQL